MANLTPKQQQEYQSELDDLHRNAAHQQKYASRDTNHPEEVDEMQKEYAKQEANLNKQFQHIAAMDAGASADAVMLAAAPLDLADEWRANLTPKQQQELQSELDDLHRNAA